MRGPGIDLKDSITDRMATRAPFGVWVPADFADLGRRVSWIKCFTDWFARA